MALSPPLVQQADRIAWCVLLVHFVWTNRYNGGLSMFPQPWWFILGLGAKMLLSHLAHSWKYGSTINFSTVLHPLLSFFSHFPSYKASPWHIVILEFHLEGVHQGYVHLVQLTSRPCTGCLGPAICLSTGLVARSRVKIVFNDSVEGKQVHGTFSFRVEECQLSCVAGASNNTMLSPRPKGLLGCAAWLEQHLGLVAEWCRCG